MEERSEKARSISGAIRSAVREGDTSADQIVAGTRNAAYAQRQAGMKKGVYVVTCDRCWGKGVVHSNLHLQYFPEDRWESLQQCEKCAGAGSLIINEDRRRMEDATMREVLIFMSLAFVTLAAGIAAALWSMNHH
jgi:hypothetical protein